MTTLYMVLTIALVFMAIGIIALVLLQKGKGADAGAAFGSGASGTVFGARGTGNFLSRATAVLATLFFANCLALAYLSGQRGGGGSLLEQETEQVREGPGQALPAEGSDLLPVPEPDAGSDSLDELPPVDQPPDGADGQ
ncbi:MAG: preprotein translocase subunit SecG [Gammaproteobacteria bacterium]|jgi:preprotein translocase subunit SecG